MGISELARMEWGEMLIHQGRYYERTGADWQGSPTESEAVLFKCRFSYDSIRRTRSVQGEERTKTAHVTCLTDVKLHVGGRITIEGVFDDDGLSLKDFEITNVQLYTDERGNEHHQTVYVR